MFHKVLDLVLELLLVGVLVLQMRVEVKMKQGGRVEVEVSKLFKNRLGRLIFSILPSIVWLLFLL